MVTVLDSIPEDAVLKYEHIRKSRRVQVWDLDGQAVVVRIHPKPLTWMPDRTVEEFMRINPILMSR